jgi:hypothetical protein
MCGSCFIEVSRNFNVDAAAGNTNDPTKQQNTKPHIENMQQSPTKNFSKRPLQSVL